MDKKNVVFAIILIWIVLIAGFVMSGEFTLKTGREVLLKTIPVDPRDLFRGEYVNLSYEIGQMPQGYSFSDDQRVYAVLKVDNKNVATVDYLVGEIPKDKFFIKGYYRKYWSSELQYGIESYFVKEGTALALEKKLRNGGYAKVIIDKNGNAKVREILN